jgi:Rod binding domain-containing protein
MTALSLATPQVDATAAPAVTAAQLARRGQIHQTAQKFEASFLTSVLQTMFQSVSTAPPFGGGPGEDMWKSFLAEAMAKDMAHRGGIGVAASVEREMLRLQGLSDGGALASTGPAGAGQAGAGQADAKVGAAQGASSYSATLRSAPLQSAAPQAAASRKATLQ